MHRPRVLRCFRLLGKLSAALSDTMGWFSFQGSDGIETDNSRRHGLRTKLETQITRSASLAAISWKRALWSLAVVSA